MISLPTAVTKAIFDLIWDLIRDGNISSPLSDRPPNVEQGIEMHHVNSENRPNNRRSSRSNDTNLVRRPKTLPTEQDVHEDVIQNQGVLAASPEIVSFTTYLKEHFDNTKLRPVVDKFITKFPTVSAALRRLPYALLPFAFSQFILVEALSYTGWINLFSSWLVTVVGFSLPATVFVVGITSVILCNASGTNIGATILLVKILKSSNFAGREGLPARVETAGMLALAVGSNIGAVSFTFSASLAGILFV